MPKKRYYYKGNRVSKGEQKVAEVLDKYKINFIREHSFADLVSNKNKRLRFDFFIPDYNLIIEVQGHHHYNPVNKYNRAKKVHEQTVLHDHLKQKYCLRRKIRLLRIPYTEIDRVEEIVHTLFTVFKNR